MVTTGVMETAMFILGQHRICLGRADTVRQSAISTGRQVVPIGKFANWACLHREIVCLVMQGCALYAVQR